MRIKLTLKQKNYMRKRVKAWKKAQQALTIARMQGAEDTNSKREAWLKIDREVTELASFNPAEGCYNVQCKK